MQLVKDSWIHSIINHPKWAVSWCALLCCLGWQAATQLQVRQFPLIPSGMIRLVATYPGADAQLIQNSVTTVLQRAIGQADSFDYIQATTTDGGCQINAYLPLGADIDRAFPSVLAQVQSVKSSLPPDLNDPVLTRARVSPLALMYVAYVATEGSALNQSEIYQYLNLVIRPQLLTVPGVGEINILGSQTPAARLWLDFDAMARYQITPLEVYSRIQSENASLPGGWVEYADFRQPLLLETQARKPADLLNIILKIDEHNNIVRISDLASFEIGAENNDVEALFNNHTGVFLSIDSLPNANALSVLAKVKEKLSALEKSLPPQLHQDVVYDASIFIEDSVFEVVRTIFEASLIVIVMIYAFLRSVHAVLIPVLAIPLSLIGVMIIMFVFGMSLNLLTLLAMMLAIGLVVDDAILIVEHTVHWRQKYPNASPIEMAKAALSSIAFPLIVMTLILAIAFLPLAFMSGLTGALFREFALTLAGAVCVSGCVALIVSPALCAYGLPQNTTLDVPWMNRLTERYLEILKNIFNHRPIVMGVILVLPLFLLGFYILLPTELAPKEDQGFALVSYRGPQTASLEYTKKYAQKIDKIFQTVPETQDRFFINGAGGFGVSSGLAGLIATPWSQRSRNMEAICADISHSTHDMPELEVYAFTPSPLPGPDGLDFQWVLYSPEDIKSLAEKADKLIAELSGTGYFAFLTTDTHINKLNQNIIFDGELAALNHVTQLQLGQNHILTLAEGRSSYYRHAGQQLDLVLRSRDRSFSEIMHQLPLMHTLNTVLTNDDFSSFYCNAVPNNIFQFNQMNSITIQGVLFPIATLGDVIAIAESHRDSLAEDGVFMDYTGPTRAYVQEHGKLVLVALAAMIIMYFLLLMLFETYVDPFLILMTIPLAICGALSAMNFMQIIVMLPGCKTYAISLNIYTELALLTLLGLITKHGILLVDVANHKRKNGLEIERAAFEAAHERFRPIIMTTIAMVVGVIPLLLAHGPGAVSRYHLGFVIATGLSLGTVFTLCCFPVVYTVVHEFFERRK